MKKERPEWMERAVEIHNFHANNLKRNRHWTMANTGKALKRSTGAVSQYLTAAQWLRTHARELVEIDSFEEAMNFIRQKEYESLTIGIDLD